ncbi:MAG: 50S ribosomal protein L6 [Verrucomicrobiales bacterium]|nr:50S ribosomal protein L6 [Verrucomicrobiales bacterium]
MSRVGNKSITVPAKVALKVQGSDVHVEGPKGKLQFTLPSGISLSQEGATLKLARKAEDRFHKALHGTSQRCISNMIKGVTEGFKKELEIHGVGFRAAVKGDKLDLGLGFSHPLLHPIPADIKVTALEKSGSDPVRVIIEGIDKQRVGQLAADIRSYYPPEPYKGKGVRYAGEQIRRKEGKKTK